MSGPLSEKAAPAARFRFYLLKIGSGWSRPVAEKAFETVRLANPSGSFFRLSRARASSRRQALSRSPPFSRKPHTHPHPHSRPDSESSFSPTPSKGLSGEPRRASEGGERETVSIQDSFVSGYETRFTQAPLRFKFRNPGKSPKCSPETDPGSPIRSETILDCSV